MPPGINADILYEAGKQTDETNVYGGLEQDNSAMWV